MHYEVLIRFGGGAGWQCDCPAAADLHVEARTLESLRTRMRAEIARAEECQPEDVQLDEVLEWPSGWGELLEQVRAARLRAGEERRRSAALTQQTVRSLAEAAPELGMRDIAALVGVSYQRVQQLLSGGRNGADGGT
jgi:hypothetical protein